MQHGHAKIVFKATDYEPVTCLIDEPGISVDSASYGGWSTIDRPKDVGLLNWDGFGPLVLTIPILLDGWTTQTSVEEDFANLEKMAGRGAGVGGRTQPPAITLSTSDGFGALVPHNFNGESLKWVITGLEWGDQLRRPGSGHRVRQAATITVTQFTSTNAEELSVAKRNNTHGRRHRVHVVKKGESLMRIARSEYGTSDRWQDIAKANDIRDPRHLRVGMRLKLPK